MAQRRDASTIWTRGWIVSAVFALPSLMGSCASPRSAAVTSDAELRMINLTEFSWTIETRDANQRPIVWELAPYATVTVHVPPGRYVFQQTAHVTDGALHRDITATFEAPGRYEWPLATLTSGSARSLR